MIKKCNDFLLTLKGIIFYNTFLKKSQFFTKDEILLKKKEWLNKLLKHCRENIPWYSIQFRKYGVKIDTDDPFFELNKLPILSKETVIDNHADFCISNAAENSLSFSTSGTTGKPLTVYTSFNQWIVEQGVIWRSWKWAGYRFRDKIAIFRSYSPLKNESKIKISRLRNWTYFSVFDMNDASLDEYLNYLIKWKPKFLRGYPSALKIICQHAIKRKVRIPSLIGAFSASEMVPEDLRDLLREAFTIELFDHYGQAEITCMFHECEEHLGMHLDWEYGHVELIPHDIENKLYKIIGTNLHNFSMPLLRYDTGDLSSGDWSTCSCSRSSTMLKSIYGRKDDYLISKDSSRMSTVNLYTYFSKLKDIKQFQIIQNVPGEISIILLFLENLDEFSKRNIKASIKEELIEKTDMYIEIISDKEFIQSDEGKMPSFIQRIKDVI